MDNLVINVTFSAHTVNKLQRVHEHFQRVYPTTNEGPKPVPAHVLDMFVDDAMSATADEVLDLLKAQLANWLLTRIE
jgi:hypothetical protein